MMKYKIVSAVTEVMFKVATQRKAITNCREELRRAPSPARCGSVVEFPPINLEVTVGFLGRAHAKVAGSSPVGGEWEAGDG